MKGAAPHTVTATAAGPSITRPPAWIVAAVAGWAAVAAFMLLTGAPQVGVVFPDTDDAMRLVEIRDFLAGQGWFDLTQARLDPPGVVMHWSRLVDLPMAMMMRGLAPLIGIGAAERVVMAIWPPLTLLPAVLALAFAAREIGGPAAGVAGAVMAALCPAVYPLFAPGRIDHHNVQIACTMILLASTLCAARRPRAGLVAGAVAAVMLAIGMETLAYVAVASAVFALRFAVASDGARETARWFGSALAAATLVLFVATVPLARWGVPVCDALGPNVTLLAVAGGLGLAGAASLVSAASAIARLAALALVGIVSLALFGALEPACLRGPYGAIDPRIVPIWLDFIPEAQSWRSLAAETPGAALLVLAFPIAGLAAAAWLWRRESRDLVVVTTVFLAAAMAVALVQVRSSGYANALAVPLVATLVAGLAASAAEAASRRWRLGIGILLLNPLTVGLAAAVTAEAARPASSPQASSRRGADCAKPAAYAGLAGEPRGLVAGYTELGSFILAATPHAVLSGPYHRNGDGIVDTYRLFTASDAEAQAIARGRGVTYVVTCTASRDLDQLRTAAPQGLAARLADDDVPAWLEAVPSDEGPIRVYRVRP
jgi:hypothetical protein